MVRRAARVRQVLRERRDADAEVGGGVVMDGGATSAGKLGEAVRRVEDGLGVGVDVDRLHGARERVLVLLVGRVRVAIRAGGLAVVVVVVVGGDEEVRHRESGAGMLLELEGWVRRVREVRGHALAAGRGRCGLRHSFCGRFLAGLIVAPLPAPRRLQIDFWHAGPRRRIRRSGRRGVEFVVGVRGQVWWASVTVPGASREERWRRVLRDRGGGKRQLPVIR